MGLLSVWGWGVWGEGGAWVGMGEEWEDSMFYLEIFTPPPTTTSPGMITISKQTGVESSMWVPLQKEQYKKNLRFKLNFALHISHC